MSTHNADSVRYVSPLGRHRLDFNHWRAWYQALTEEQREFLQHKARWEGMTLSAVSMEWGVPAAHLDGDDRG